MESWSDEPYRQFKIKIFLDTNILTCIVDKTHDGLSKSIDILKSLEFVDLVSSTFVAFEFAGIRKREHFLRQVILKSASSSSGHFNYSSIFQIRNNFQSEDVKFEDIQPDIQKSVEDEIEDIINSYEINYSNNIFHKELYKPTLDICLNSRVSKEDSFVLISAILPQPGSPEKNVTILTKDKDFIKSYYEFPLDSIFSKYGLTEPNILDIRNIKLSSGRNINLLQNIIINLTKFWKDKILELIQMYNKDKFLGLTFTPKGATFPKDVICFTLPSNTQLNSNIYVSIIGHNLDFIYTTKFRVEDFWNNGSIGTYPFISQKDAYISFKIFEFDDGAQSTPLPISQINKLRENGNLVFIHDDS